MNVRYISVFAAIVLGVLLVMPILSSSGSGIIIKNAHARYAANSQIQANTNECDNIATCAITSPLLQGDGSTNAATNTQNPQFSEQGEGDLSGNAQAGPPLGTIQLFDFLVHTNTCSFSNNGNVISCDATTTETSDPVSGTLTCLNIPGGGPTNCAFQPDDDPSNVIGGLTCPNPVPNTGDQTITCRM
jgi:hypothetical protein